MSMTTKTLRKPLSALLAAVAFVLGWPWPPARLGRNNHRAYLDSARLFH